jgi:hypothetical protein
VDLKFAIALGDRLRDHMGDGHRSERRGIRRTSEMGEGGTASPPYYTVCNEDRCTRRVCSLDVP